MYSIQQGVHSTNVFSKSSFEHKTSKAKWVWQSLHNICSGIFLLYWEVEEKEGEINTYYMATFKETKQNKKTQGHCLWKINKRILKTKKYMKLYSTLKTNSHFIKFCLFGGYTSCNGNIVWFTALPLRSLFLNKHYLPSGKWHLSNHIFSLFCTLFQWPNHT